MSLLKKTFFILSSILVLGLGIIACSPLLIPQILSVYLPKDVVIKQTWTATKIKETALETPAGNIEIHDVAFKHPLVHFFDRVSQSKEAWLSIDRAIIDLKPGARSSDAGQTKPPEWFWAVWSMLHPTAQVRDAVITSEAFPRVSLSEVSLNKYRLNVTSLEIKGEHFGMDASLDPKNLSLSIDHRELSLNAGFYRQQRAWFTEAKGQLNPQSGQTLEFTMKANLSKPQVSELSLLSDGVFEHNWDLSFWQDFGVKGELRVGYNDNELTLSAPSLRWRDEVLNNTEIQAVLNYPNLSIKAFQTTLKRGEQISGKGDIDLIKLNHKGNLTLAQYPLWEHKVAGTVDWEGQGKAVQVGWTLDTPHVGIASTMDIDATQSPYPITMHTLTLKPEGDAMFVADGTLTVLWDPKQQNLYVNQLNPWKLNYEGQTALTLKPEGNHFKLSSSTKMLSLLKKKLMSDIPWLAPWTTTSLMLEQKAPHHHILDVRGQYELKPYHKLDFYTQVERTKGYIELNSEVFDGDRKIFSCSAKLPNELSMDKLFNDTKLKLEAHEAPFALLEPATQGLVRPVGYFDGHVEGTLKRGLNGKLQIKDLKTNPYNSTFAGLSNVQGELELKNRQLITSGLTGLYSGQPITAVGSIGIDKHPKWNVHVETPNLMLSRETGFILRGDASVDITTKASGKTFLTGQVTLKNSSLFSRLISIFQDDGSIDTDYSQPFFSAQIPHIKDWVCGIDLVGSSFLKIKLPYLNATTSGSAQLVGTLENPEIRGQVTLDTGKVVFPYGTLELKEGTLDFDPSRHLAPIIQAQASGSVQNYAVDLDITGNLNQIQTEFNASPALEKTEILALMTAGSIPNETNDTTHIPVAGIGTFVGKGLLLDLGITNDDEGKLEVELSNQTSDNGKNPFKVKYKVDHNLSIEAERDIYDTYSIDFVQKLFSR